MNFLSDLVVARSKEMRLQMTRIQNITPKVTEWMQHKELLRSLPVDYEALLRGKLRIEPQMVKRKEYGNNYVVTVKFPEYPAFETVLQIVEHKTKGLFSVAYIAVNKETNTVCTRELLGNYYR